MRIICITCWAEMTEQTSVGLPEVCDACFNSMTPVQRAEVILCAQYWRIPERGESASITSDARIAKALEEIARQSKVNANAVDGIEGAIRALCGYIAAKEKAARGEDEGDDWKHPELDDDPDDNDGKRPRR